MNPQAFGKYQLLKKLATGGMAEVWLARQTGIEGFQKELVVKRILPHLAEDREFVEMFKNEALIAARFNHPNIAQVYEFGEANGTYYIAMEFIHGEDLGRVMRKASGMNQWIARPLAIRIVASACEGLYYAHSRNDDRGQPLNVVHRDISPQNILISFDGSVKLVDFGIAKAADQASMTKSGAIKGKFAYMAPEQAAGKHLDRRADIFAIGLVLYEMLTGHRPLKKDSELATLQAAMECAIPSPSEVADVPRDMDHVVMRALAKSADDRYDNAREFQTALEELLVNERWLVTSGQISELMKTLFAERLEEELRQGQFVPVGEDSNTSPPRPPPDMNWEAPPGEPSQSRDRSRSNATRTGAAPRRSTGMSPALAEDPNEYDAPSLTGVEPQPRRRSSVSEPAVRRGTSTSNPNATQIARTNSRSDLRSQSVDDVPPPRRTASRAVPVSEPPMRSRSGVHRMDLEDDERTRLPPPEDDSETEPAPAPPPPRRRTSTSQSAVEPPRRRTSSRVDAPRPRPVAPPVDDEDSGERRPSRSSAPALPEPARSKGGSVRALVTVGLVVGLLAMGVLFREPIMLALTSKAADAQGVWLTVNTNQPVKVSVRHTERCNSPEPVTMLGTAPLTRVQGAHLQDTLILENDAQGIYLEDSEELAFGQPGELKTFERSFKEGTLKLKITPRGMTPGLTVYRNNQMMGSASTTLKLMEGKQRLELRGKQLKEPVAFEATIKADETTDLPLDLASAL
ncbi:serine/threonine protein kinase [Corallococcus coralloides DSM 2259]|uniref:Serine/threonine protein kinase n=1 Tax=Corallococcus coralloides (strain ATCC 25202 / DSM 2259 / NBRC 100086 / M2) TaxID=1144275 RepID=H8MZ22_CORCM|nr:serine/threonine-protein kinase [Corallococcus coralloides]AFE09336.1 serine/threonine protein kinase [Corallococcus coralloides DSM 2259]